VSIDVSIPAVVTALAAAGLEHANVGPHRPGTRAVIEGRARVAEHTLDIRVHLPNDFPLQLPWVFVADPDALGNVPHLTANGSICYHEGEGSVQSIWHPERVAADALKLALRTLEGSLTGSNTNSLFEEVEWWWSRQRERYHAWCSRFEPGDDIAILYRAGPLIEARRRSLEGQGFAVSDRGLYVPANSRTDAYRFRLASLLRPAGLRRVLNEILTPEQHRHLLGRLRHNTDFRFLVLGLRRPSGDLALIGLEFNGPLDPHPLVDDPMTDETTLEPALIQRLDRARIVERGGADPCLARATVAVVGCGAVGGYVVEALARTGVGKLVLIDHDILSPENAFRHTLGWSMSARILQAISPSYKVALLAMSLTTSLLELVDVTPIPTNIQTALEQNLLDLRSVDLMIVAVGDPTLSRWLNLELLGRDGPRALYTWLEPLGVGGHALLTGMPGSPGCYECLCLDSDGCERLSPSTDFVAPNQPVLSRVAGCGTSYTPFSDLDARRTAELAVRLAVRALTGDPSPRLRSWRGDDEAARARQLLLTERHAASRAQLDMQETSFAGDGCALCRRAD
jgi:hypothetical protein